MRIGSSSVLARSRGFLDFISEEPTLFIDNLSFELLASYFGRSPSLTALTLFLSLLLLDTLTAFSPSNRTFSFFLQVSLCSSVYCLDLEPFLPSNCSGLMLRIFLMASLLYRPILLRTSLSR
jgi:hypothetical protein